MKDIPGYEGQYAITSCGRVWSYSRKKFLKTQTFEDGYKHVILYKNKRQVPFLVHRLVALTYIPNPNDYPCVNHKDEVKDNNWIKNLEWCSRSYNARYGTAIHRKQEKLNKPVMCNETGECFPSYKKACEALGFPPGAIASYFYYGMDSYKGYTFTKLEKRSS